MLDTAPTSSPNHNQILEDAWLRFAKYDQNAGIAQKRFIQQRRWILVLGVAATTLGVSYSIIEKHVDENHINFNALSSFLGIPVSKEQFLNVLHFPVLVVPIVLGVLVAISVKFNMGISWVMLRSSAEAIKKEIYRYRMQVGEFNPAKVTPTETRDIRLARTLKLVSKRLMQTSVNQTDLVAYKDSLPPANNTAKGDDGFSDLTAEQYLTWRVEDQFNYYQKKAARLGKDLRRFQLVIFLLSAVGTLLAGLKFDVWIAVSSALAAAFAAYLEFRRVESNVVACNIAAADLYDIRVWWHALSPEARSQQVNIETLVASTEAVLQTENAGWLQEMREALAEIYGDKKDKSSHEDQKSLDDVNSALKPDAIAVLANQDPTDLFPSAISEVPELEPSSTINSADSNPVAPSKPVDPKPVVAEPLNTDPADSSASSPESPTTDTADAEEAREPGLGVDVSDPTAAEAIR